MKRKIKSIVKNIPMISNVARYAYHGFFRKDVAFDTSGQYWEERYAQAGDSGDGSYGRLAAFKAEIINDFVQRQGIKEVIEFGCGDGAQLKRMNYVRYTGVDVSPKIIDHCKDVFKNDSSKNFFHVDDLDVSNINCDLALSLDVIYHLVEDDVFETYMRRLLSSSNRWAIIYSSNFDSPTSLAHVRHRKFSDWMKEHAKSWDLYQKIDQRYPFKPNGEKDTSFAEFYIYRLKA